MQVVEGFGGRIGGHRLRQKGVGEVRIEQRLDLLDRISAHRERRFHHQPGVAQGFLFGVFVEKAMRDDRRDAHPADEDDQQDKIEFQSQTHALFPRRGQVRTT